MGIAFIDTGVYFTAVTNPDPPGARTDEKEYTMLGCNLGGSNFSSPGLTTGIGGDSGTITVQPVPSDQVAYITNIYVYCIDEDQNDRNCWVEAVHGHGCWWSLRKGHSVTTPSTAPAEVSGFSQRRAPNGAFYGYTAPWVLPGFTPNGDIHQGVNFSSRIWLEVYGSEYLTVSIRRKTGATVAGSTNKLTATIRVCGVRVPVGTMIDFRTVPLAVSL